MKRPTKLLIVGAGGIACALLPNISRLADIVIADEDNYEPKNSSRQFPALKSTGNKAEVLAAEIQRNTLQKVDFIPKYLQNNRLFMDERLKRVDMIIGCVDNNPSRRIIRDVCLDMNIPAIMGGNLSDFGEAHLVVPGVYDPFDHFEFRDSDPAPWACNADKTIEAEPQTPLANMMAASAILHIFLSWEKAMGPRTAVCHSRLDPFNSTYA